ncbi:hypothetical protein Hanom_Chr01g00063551 [Helianthus anomalus]
MHTIKKTFYFNICTSLNQSLHTYKTKYNCMFHKSNSNKLQRNFENNSTLVIFFNRMHEHICMC